MPNLDPNEASKKLDDKGKEFAEKLLSNPSLINMVNNAWNNPAISKINWKELKKQATDQYPKKGSEREGYYSVIFLTNEKGIREPYLIANEIAKGGKAVLKNAYNLATGDHVALKIVRGVTTDDPLQQEEHARETAGLTFLKRYRGSQKRDKKQYLAQDYIKGRDLDHYRSGTLEGWFTTLDKKSDECLGLFKTVLQILTSTLSETHNLHREGFVHRDLKGLNLMLIENPSAKESESKVAQVLIIDFGGMDKQPGELRSFKLGTVGYLAPELKGGADNLPFSQSSDLYAIGLVFKDLINNLDNSTIKAYFMLKNKPLKKDAEKIVTTIKELIDKMTKEDPKERITTEEAYNSMLTLLSEVDPSFGYDKLTEKKTTISPY